VSRMAAAGAEKTAFIVHPPDLDLFRSYIRFLKPDKSYRNELLIKLFEWTPSFKVKEFPQLHVDGGGSIDATLIMVPFLPEMRDISVRHVTGKIDAALGIAAQAGCTVAALGGFTSIVLQGREEDFSRRHGLRITSGNALTAAIILKSLERVARTFNFDLAEIPVAIIGASGDIGSACMGYLCTRVKRLYATGRSLPSLREAAGRLGPNRSCDIIVTTDNREAVDNSRLCIFVTSSYDYLFTERDFKPGTVVCDASAPLNVKIESRPRDDVFIYHGGIASIPFPIDAGFDIGLPSPYTFYGCQLEGLLLGLYPELPCSWGRGNISQEKLMLFMDKLDECPSIAVAFSHGTAMYTDEQINAYAGKWKTFRRSGHGAASPPSSPGLNARVSLQARL
jgi:fatty aldehyde-generating acyl-ACP reductase